MINKATIKKCVLVGLGVVVGLIGCESLLRLMISKSAFVAGFSYEVSLSTELFVRDDAFGVRPRLGTDMYDECGTKLVVGRDSRAKTPGKKRILFVGDSVTFRGAITDACQSHFGDAKFAYWNAGVESFNTQQEVLFYKKYNHLVEPDHVILVFHHNDFTVTPVAFPKSDSQVSVVFSNRSVPLNTWLYGKSYLYRLWFEWKVKGVIRQSLEDGVVAVRERLQELRDLISKEGGRLTVLVLPLCKPIDHWSDIDRATHQHALRILRELHIAHVDLLPALESAIEDGIELQETKGDVWHPSNALGEAFVRYMAAHGFKL